MEEDACKRHQRRVEPREGVQQKTGELTAVLDARRAATDDQTSVT